MNNISSFYKDDDSYVIENIKATMAVEKHVLNDDEINVLKMCYNKEMNVEDALEEVRKDISARMVK